MHEERIKRLEKRQREIELESTKITEIVQNLAREHEHNIVRLNLLRELIIEESKCQKKEPIDKITSPSLEPESTPSKNLTK